MATSPNYPTPDRSDQVRHVHKDEDGVIDIGWCDGVMGGNRPYFAEMWAQDQVSMLTLFFSSKDIDHFTSDQVRDMIVKEGLVAFRSKEETFCECRPFTDCAGNALWSVNIVVGSDLGLEDDTYLTASVPIFPYDWLLKGNQQTT
jgi:hypothetical protein